MKKLIAFAIAAIMVISMIPAMAFTASAANGDWKVYRAPSQTDVLEGEPYQPAPGYSYTSEGFTTTENAADYTNTTPKFTVQTAAKQNIKEGIYMKVRLDDFDHKGFTADNWISFNLSDVQNIENGSTKYGNNWTCLIRHKKDELTGNNVVRIQSFITHKDTEEAPGSFTMIGEVDIPDANIQKDNGKEIYTFEVVWNEEYKAYEIKICGVGVIGANYTEANELDARVTTEMAKFGAGDMFYVGFSMSSGVAHSKANMTILKYGNDESSATTPTGDDSAEAEANIFEYGDKIEASAVETNKPALLLNTDYTKTAYREPTTSSMTLTAQGDGTYHAKTSTDGCYLTWKIKQDITYNVEDFPVFTMLMKNYYGKDGDSGKLYYCAGDTLAANDDDRVEWAATESYSSGDDTYILVAVDLTGRATGRIHSMRTDFLIDMQYAEYGDNEWDICYMGMFRNEDEAIAYTEEYLTAKGVDVTEETKKETEAPADEETTAPEVDETKKPADKTDEEDEDDEDSKDDEKSGCGATLVGGSAAALMIAAAAAVALKKKD